MYISYIFVYIDLFVYLLYMVKQNTPGAKPLFFCQVENICRQRVLSFFDSLAISEYMTTTPHSPNVSRQSLPGENQFLLTRDL